MSSLRFLIILLVLATNYFSRITTDAASSLPTLSKRRMNLNGVHLKFGAIHMPPFDVLTLRPDGNYTHTGSGIVVYSWLAAKLNFTFSYYFVPNAMTKAKYGNISEISTILNLMDDKVIDASAMGMIATPVRKKLVDLVYVIWTESFVMVVPVPGEEPRLFAFILPFQSTVWLLILITVITMVAIMSLFSKFYLKFFAKIIAGRNKLDPIPPRKETLFRLIINYAIYIINIMTNQGGSVALGVAITRLSFRVLVGVWLLIATVLVNSYSGTVISYLTVPKMKPPINTFDDLIASEDIGLVLLADTDAKTGPLKVLGDQMRSKPDRIVSNVPKLYKKLETEHFAFPFQKTFCQNFVSNDFKKDGKCRFKLTDPINVFGLWSLPLQKDSKYSSMFNIALMELWEAGIPSFSVKNAMPRADKCFAKTKPQASSRQIPIQLDDLMGAFFILGIGLSLAMFAFIVEIITEIKEIRRRCNNKNTIPKK
uniref:Ionotropic glutamate receptor C-terminal domain-containing protein n=1 Tax=Daphnia galeata TaxID=27404 RepID=A0A8J2RBE8_9CRUS|nr:unnamed protein product [Daphnia galeata]